MSSTINAGGRWQPVRWVLATVTFILGVAVGVIAVGLLSSGKPDFPTIGPPAVSPTATSEATTPTAGASAVAQVNPACLEVISDAQRISRILSGVGDAAADVDLQRLDDIVRELQPIQTELERDLPACQVDTTVGSGAGPSNLPSLTPTASPS